MQAVDFYIMINVAGLFFKRRNLCR